MSYTIQTLCYAVCYFHSCSTHKIKKYRPIGCRPVRRFHYFYSGNGSDLQLFVYVCHVLQNLLQRRFFGVRFRYWCWLWFSWLRCFCKSIQTSSLNNGWVIGITIIHITLANNTRYTFLPNNVILFVTSYVILPNAVWILIRAFTCVLCTPDRITAFDTI